MKTNPLKRLGLASYESSENIISYNTISWKFPRDVYQIIVVRMNYGKNAMLPKKRVKYKRYVQRFRCPFTYSAFYVIFIAFYASALQLITRKIPNILHRPKVIKLDMLTFYNTNIIWRVFPSEIWWKNMCICNYIIIKLCK